MMETRPANVICSRWCKIKHGALVEKAKKMCHARCTGNFLFPSVSSSSLSPFHCGFYLIVNVILSKEKCNI